MYKKCVTHLVLLNIFTPASSWRERLFWPIKVIPEREFNYDRGKVLFEKYLNPWYSAHVHVNCVWGRDWWRPIQTAPASWRAAMNWGWEKHTEREATPKKKTCIFGHCPNCDLTPPYCANPGTLWHNFFADNEKVLKTAILTLGMNILTMIKVKDDSEMVFWLKSR